MVAMSLIVNSEKFQQMIDGAFGVPGISQWIQSRQAAKLKFPIAYFPGMDKTAIRQWFEDKLKEKGVVNYCILELRVSTRYAIFWVGPKI